MCTPYYEADISSNCIINEPPHGKTNNLHRCLYMLVCVGPVRKPHFWFSHEAALIIWTFYHNAGPFVLGNLSEKEDTHFKAISNGSFHANTNKHPNYKKTMLEETRYLLYAFYKPFNQALAQLLADPGFDYGPY